MLLHFDFEPTTPTWRQFQQALEKVAQRSVSMKGGPSAGGGPETWVAKLSGLSGTLVLDYQNEDTRGLVIHAYQAHREFVVPLVAVFEGARRSPRAEARIASGGQDYSNGPNPYAREWFELSANTSVFKLDLGYFLFLFGDAEQHQPAQIVVQLLELERDKPQRSLVLAPSEVRELRTLLASDAPRFGEPQDAYLAEDVRCCREDLSNWLEAHEHTSDPIMVARHL